MRVLLSGTGIAGSILQCSSHVSALSLHVTVARKQMAWFRGDSWCHPGHNKLKQKVTFIILMYPHSPLYPPLLSRAVCTSQGSVEVSSRQVYMHSTGRPMALNEVLNTGMGYMADLGGD